MTARTALLPTHSDPSPIEYHLHEMTDASMKDRAIALAKRYLEIVVAVNVGNEALVTWNDHLVDVDALLDYARRVKGAIAQPVTTADNDAVFRDYGPRLAAVLDFFMVHSYPAWEGEDVDEAIAYTVANLQGVRDVAPGARIVIGEAGWPSLASEFGDRASEAKQRRYYDELTAWGAANNVTTLVFEAFDEDWKGDPGDPLGAEKHWGLFTVDRKAKLVMQGRYPDLAPALGPPSEVKIIARGGRRLRARARRRALRRQGGRRGLEPDAGAVARRQLGPHLGRGGLAAGLRARAPARDDGVRRHLALAPPRGL
ncbi:MAG: hypothetical protein CVV17_11860, partial [Gammaproteobacteria bacterium HGW-Gammaproteobacteria-7]